MPALGQHDALDTLRARQNTGFTPSPRVQRAVANGVAIEHGRGIVQAARVRAVEYVATQGMQALMGLSALEASYIQMSPLGEPRYRAIADIAAIGIADIVADTGRR